MRGSHTMIHWHSSQLKLGIPGLLTANQTDLRRATVRYGCLTRSDKLPYPLAVASFR